MAGISPFQLTYPDDLKDPVWQRKKGALAKAKKTGIGDLLKQAEKAFSKFEPVKLDLRAAPPKTMAALTEAIKEAKAYHAKTLAPVAEMMTKIITQCDKVTKENALLLKGAKSGIADVRKAADTFRVSIKSVDLETDVKYLSEQINRRQDLAKKHINDALKNFLIGAKAFLDDPTPDSWGANIKQQGRSVSNSVKELEAYNAKFWKEFSKFQGFDIGTLKLDAKSPDFGKTASKIVAAAAKQVKDIAAFKPD